MVKGFVKFTAGHRIVIPKLSIYPSGQVGINALCLDQYDLRKYSYVTLWYDPDRKRIGFQFTNDTNIEGIYKVRPRSGRASDITARAFLRYWDIDHRKTKRYTPEFNQDGNMLVIQLDSSA